MGRIIITILVFLFPICIFSKNIGWTKELDKLDERLSKEYKKKYNFFLEGTGGGGVQGFHMYSPRFVRYLPTTKEEARVLCLEVAEDLLKRINKNPILVKGMVSSPFTPKNIDFVIFFNKSDGSFVEKGAIYSVSIAGYSIRYGYETQPDRPSDWVYEPLKEALEKFEESHERFPYLWECVHQKETL